MQLHGFEETQAAYLGADSRNLLGQVRRFGTAGPAYEIVAVDDSGNVMIEVICSRIRSLRRFRNVSDMFAIAFDMTVADIREHYPKGISSAYAEIGKVIAPFGFERVQGSVYVTPSSDMAQLLAAVLALKALHWFPICVRDVRGFKVESWSDFTQIVKGER
jgi:virulence-associated protein VapD